MRCGLQAMDARSLLGRHDTSLYLKAQVDNLTGHNEELRKTLRETRYEATKANVELDKMQNKVNTWRRIELHERSFGGL